MRHRVAGRTLNRNTKQRAGLLKSLARELVEHGAIVTTVPKAKELKRMADKLVATAKGENIEARRTLHRFFGKRDIVNTLVERVAPASAGRTSGYTRIVLQGIRSGDNARLARIEWVDMPENVGSLRNPTPVERTTTKKKAPVKAASVAKETKKVAPAKKETATKKVAAKKPAAKKETAKKTTKK